MTSDHMEFEKPTRRGFLFVTTGAVAAVGVPFAAWPLIDQMNPDAAATDKARLVVDISKLQPGANMIVNLIGEPILIRHRTPQEIESARSVELDELTDQLSRNLANPKLDASDSNRTIYRDGRILVMSPVCTYLGCVLIQGIGDFDGFFCPCCGSHYDTSGRVRSGPAPENLWVPKYKIWDRDRIRLDASI